ncbi:MAG: tetraacyldisaccharide 4'-kinase [Alphaproteobacteria bacterium]|nr:tetraacyldisaccharide 4'-kinase [Alphaproteobacteria bacterium]MCZ6764998.1 tetraacyldisaccharide 4'-kinase [Alphaproteobacteria bacterium]
MRAPDFWYGDTSSVMPVLLRPLGAVFSAGGVLRQLLIKAEAAPVPVICVGNLVAGGAGKTPVALALADLTRKHGWSPAFVTRGYGGRYKAVALKVEPELHRSIDVGDEALLLAAAGPCWVARDRRAGARAAIVGGADLIVMDDGFQNPGLRKDLSLVVVDGAVGFGNGRIIPAGPLREPIGRGLARADAVVVMGKDRRDVAAEFGPAVPVLRAELKVADADDPLAGRPVVAFAGIGRPEKFFDTLEGIGCALLGRHAFADHHDYSHDEVTSICAEAEIKGAIPVTTEKDAVRLPSDLRARVRVLKVVVDWRDVQAVETILARLDRDPR